MPVLLDGQPLAPLPSSSSLRSRQRSTSSTTSSSLAGHNIDYSNHIHGSDGSRASTAIRLRPSGSSLAAHSMQNTTNGLRRASNSIANASSDSSVFLPEGSASDKLRNRISSSQVSTRSQRSNKPDYTELLASAMLPSDSKESDLSRAPSAPHSVTASGSVRDRHVRRSSSRASVLSNQPLAMTNANSDVYYPEHSTLGASAHTSTMHSKMLSSPSNTYSRVTAVHPMMMTSPAPSAMNAPPNTALASKALPAIRGFTSFPTLPNDSRGHSRVPPSGQPPLIGSISSAGAIISDSSTIADMQAKSAMQAGNLSPWSVAFPSPSDASHPSATNQRSSRDYAMATDSYIASLGREPLYARTDDGREIVLPASGQVYGSSSGRPWQERVVDSPKATLSTPSDHQALYTQAATAAPADRSLKRRANSLGSSRRPAVPHVSTDGTRRLSRSGRTTPTNHSRKGSYTTSGQYSSNSSATLSSRFVRYDSRPDLFRLQSYKFGELDSAGNGQDSTDSEGDETETDSPRNVRRQQRSRTARSRSSMDQRRAEHFYQKLVTSRLPGKKSMTPEHRHEISYRRAPSQPLGITWICGSRTAARSPSFYGDFDFQKIPGGRRRKSTGSRDVGTSNGINVHTSARPSESSTVGRPSQFTVRAPELDQAKVVVDMRNPLKSSEDRALPSLPRGERTEHERTEHERTEQADAKRLGQVANPGDDKYTVTSTGLHISGPVHMASSQVSELIRTPRAAPLPDMDWPAESSAYSPLSPTRSDIRWVNPQWDNTDQPSSDEESEIRELENRRTRLLQALSPRLGPLVDSAASSRELVSAVLAEASEIAPLQLSTATVGRKKGMETPDERIPKSPIIAPMYITGRIISSTVIPVDQASLHGSVSPAFADLADFEASRVITGDIEWKSFPSPVLDRAALGQAANPQTPTHVRMSPGTLDKYIAKSQEGHISDAGHTVWTGSLEGPYESSPAMSSTESVSGGITPVACPQWDLDRDTHNVNDQFRSHASGDVLHMAGSPDVGEKLSLSSHSTQPNEQQQGPRSGQNGLPLDIEAAHTLIGTRENRYSLLSNDSHIAPSSVFTAQEQFEDQQFMDSDESSPVQGRKGRRDNGVLNQVSPDVARLDTVQATAPHSASFLDISRSDLTLNKIRKRQPQNRLPDILMNDLGNLSVATPGNLDMYKLPGSQRTRLHASTDTHEASDAESDSFATAESAYSPSQRMRTTSSNISSSPWFLHESPSFNSAKNHIPQPAVTGRSAYTPSTATVNTFYTATAEQERSNPFDTVPHPTGAVSESVDTDDMYDAPVEGRRTGSRNSFIDFDDRNESASDQDDSRSFLDAGSDDEDVALSIDQSGSAGLVKNPSSIAQAVRMHHTAHRPSVIVERGTCQPAGSEDTDITRGVTPDSAELQRSLLSPDSAYPDESVRTSGSDFVDSYLRSGSDGTSASRISLLDIPGSPSGNVYPGDRSHRVSQAASHSNVSVASDLSGIVDFPVPPTTTRSERTNPMESITSEAMARREDDITHSGTRNALILSKQSDQDVNTAGDTSFAPSRTDEMQERAAQSQQTHLSPGHRFSFLDLSVSPERSPLAAGRIASRFPSISGKESDIPHLHQFEVAREPKELRKLSALSTATRERTNSDPSAWSHASWISRQRASIESASSDDRRHSWRN